MDQHEGEAKKTDLLFKFACFWRVVEEPFIVVATWWIGSHGFEDDGWAEWMEEEDGIWSQTGGQN